jgi:hypothetical protein
MLHVVDPAGEAITRSHPIRDHAIIGVAVAGTALLLIDDHCDDLIVVERTGLTELRRLTGSNAPPSGVVVLDERRCAAGDQHPPSYRIWDLYTGAVLAAVPPGTPEAIMVLAAARSPDGARLAVLTDIGGGVLLDAVTLERIAPISGGWACAWTPDNRLLIGDLGDVMELDRDGAVRRTVRPFRDAGNITALALSDDGAWIAAATEAGRIWIVGRQDWDAAGA